MKSGLAFLILPRAGPQRSLLLCAMLIVFALAGCVSTPTGRHSSAKVPRLVGGIAIDGRLTEPCYSHVPFVSQFVVAGAPTKSSQQTKAWVFWEAQRLVFAFDVADMDVVAAPASGRERDVDLQDRVELFLWSGQSNDSYHCIEIGARGAVHDYAARFYRQFDDTWSPAGWKYALTTTPAGYIVEGELSRAAIEAMGLRLVPGSLFRLGLFRADFCSESPTDPTWICWVDAREPKPDFHVAASFGEVILSTESP